MVFGVSTLSVQIHVDITEPGHIFHALRLQANKLDCSVHRSLLHKRTGLGPAGARAHPFYGRGGDYVVALDERTPLAGIERKSCEDLARSVTSKTDGRGSKIFRQMQDLRIHPTPLLIIEGAPTPLFLRVEPALAGFQVWCAREGISIIYTSSPAGTVAAVLGIVRRLSKDLGLADASNGEPYPSGEA